MRRAAALLVLATAGNGLAACGTGGAAVPHAAPRPARVMSVNQCTDQLVLMLLPPRRIASVSWLSRDPGGSVMADAALRVPTNRGSAEEVLAQRPDLVVAGTFTTPALRGMLHRVGWPVLEVDHPATFEDIRRITRQVAAAVGERARGEALIADMDAKLADLARDPGPAVRVVAWDRSGFSAGAGSLYDAVLTAAGAVNLARDPAALGGRRPDVEVLLRADPALLVEGAASSEGASLGDAVTRHRLVRRRWAARTVTIPQAYYVCGTPRIADAAIRLRDALRTAARRLVSPAPSRRSRPGIHVSLRAPNAQRAARPTPGHARPDGNGGARA